MYVKREGKREREGRVKESRREEKRSYFSF
jgi:hypothetical protein